MSDAESPNTLRPRESGGEGGRRPDEGERPHPALRATLSRDAGEGSSNSYKAALAAIAPLFRYPDGSHARYLDEARKHGGLDSFAAEISRLDLAQRQSVYTATFDLAPSCTPYLGVHLFGDDNPGRARLMVGLRLAYRRAGLDSDGQELPDHVADVLSFAAIGNDESDDLIHLVLVPALTRMDAILAPTSNPWRHLVAATLRHMDSGGAS